MSHISLSCIICKEPSKYKCPGCLKQTCSLKCVNSHKTNYNCSGMPDKTKFEPVKELDTTSMHRDMNFLTEIIRGSDRAHKVITKLSRHDNRKRFTLLQNECRQRSIQIRILPKAMSKHINNSTVYMKSEGIIYWHLEWIFLSNNKEIPVQSSNNADEDVLSTHLSKALEIYNAMPEFVYEMSKSPGKDFMVLWNTNKKKVQGKGEKVFQRLDSTKKLNEIIQDFSQKYSPIVEYPTLYLTTHDFAGYHFIKEN